MVNIAKLSFYMEGGLVRFGACHDFGPLHRGEREVKEQQQQQGARSRLLLDMRTGQDRYTALILAVTRVQHQVRWRYCCMS